MESTTQTHAAEPTPSPASSTDVRKQAYRAYRILQAGFVAAPVLAGLDKFFGILVDWEQYLVPFVDNLIGASTFMAIVGIVEIVAGIGVAVKPRIFAYVVSAWLGGIIINLLLIPGYYDIALRDLGLALGALALGLLSQEFDRS